MHDIVSILSREGVVNDTAAEQVRTALSTGESLDDALRSAIGKDSKDGVGEEKLLRSPAISRSPSWTWKPGPPRPRNCWQVPRPAAARPPAPAAGGRRRRVLVATSRVFDTAGLDELRLATGLGSSAGAGRRRRKSTGRPSACWASVPTRSSRWAPDDDDVTVIEEQRRRPRPDAASAAQDASIIKFVNQILAEALESRATDVHVEPFENQLRVRYRVDGVLVEANIPPQVRKYHAAIVSRIKILSHLDIAEKRLPQDGRIRLKVGGREIDLRVSRHPDDPRRSGGAAYSRPRRRDRSASSTWACRQRDRDAWDEVLDLPHGIVLVTGPTGSGKTTTLYAALVQDQPDRSEDHHDRRPGRISASRHQPDPGEHQDRA